MVKQLTVKGEVTPVLDVEFHLLNIPVRHRDCGVSDLPADTTARRIVPVADGNGGSNVTA